MSEQDYTVFLILSGWERQIPGIVLWVAPDHGHAYNEEYYPPSRIYAMHYEGQKNET